MRIHEVLPVADSLKGQMAKVIADLGSTFKDKRHLFSEQVIQVNPFKETEKSSEERQSTLQSTVPQELKWVSETIAKAIDASMMVDNANTVAKANIELDGQVLAANVPATSLLELEKSITRVKELINLVPTLDPAKGYTPCADRDNVFKARDVNKTRTKKEKQVLTLAPATDKHPAQVQVYDADVAVAKLIEQEFSGMVTPQAKADMLGRVEDLIRAIRSARARANNVEVPQTTKIGQVLLDYVLVKKS